MNDTQIKIRPCRRFVATALRGYFDATYDEVFARFGPPNSDACDKVTSEWSLEINGQVVTIYDYRAQTPHCAFPTTHYEWHIGGTSPLAVNLIKACGFANARSSV